MRILFISNYSQLYGANRSMLTVIEHFKSKGHTVVLILPQKGEICKELEAKGIEYIIIKCFTQLYYFKPNLKYLSLPLLAIYSYFKLNQLNRFAGNFKPDLIYSNTSAENLGIKIAHKLGVKHISHIREFMDLDHGARFIFGNKAKMKYINQSDGVIYVSKSVAEPVNMGMPLQEWQEVVYNGIQTMDWKYKEKNILDEINLGVVGIFDPEKGQDLAIRLMPKVLEIYPKAKLHLWGDKEGKYKQSLLKMVNEYSLTQNVIFHGFEKDPNVIYGEMHILLMCSKCEGFGRVTIEAMQRAIPVLGFNSGGTSELVKDGHNGFLFNNSEDFILGLKKLLSSNVEYNRIRKSAYEDSRSNYSTELYCSRVENFVNKIMLL